MFKQISFSYLPAMITRLSLVIIASLVFATSLSSCISQPRASLLAADIAKLGFIPGQPVTMPPGFKAERSKDHQYRTYFHFANGSYVVDENEKLSILMLHTPRLDDPNAQADGMTKEQEDAASKTDSSLEIIEPKIPHGKRSRIDFLTWEQRDVFSLTEKELLKTYGSPSEPPTGLKKMTLPLGEGVPEYSFHVNFIQYTFQTGVDEYWRVMFSLYKQKDGKVLIDYIGMMKFVPTEKYPLSKLKVYPWPGLYPAPSAK